MFLSLDLIKKRRTAFFFKHLNKLRAQETKFGCGFNRFKCRASYFFLAPLISHYKTGCEKKNGMMGDIGHKDLR